MSQISDPEPLDDRLPRSEPGPGMPRQQIAWQLAVQSRACRAAGSPLYGDLLLCGVSDVLDGGPLWHATADHVAPGRGNALALRLMAAVHRLALTGCADGLAQHLATTGGEVGAGVWHEFRCVVEEHLDTVRDYIALPCQTNEPGRSAALAVGYLTAARRSELPLAINEIGAAAGLNLVWDRFHYSGGGQAWGDPASPVDLRGFWGDLPDLAGLEARVVQRRGVDLRPIDAASDAGRLSLLSSVWGDQAERGQRVAAACDLAAALGVVVEAGDAAEWLEGQLSPKPGVVTVVTQSVLDEYLDDEARARVDEAMARAGSHATEEAPLARLRLEPIAEIRQHGLSMTYWPGGVTQRLTVSSPLGRDVRVWESGKGQAS